MALRIRRRQKPRQQEILDAARDVLLDEGYGAFSIEAVAAAMGYSRPGIYKHFSCKEEIVFALAIATERQQQRLRERALLFRGRPRERLIAVGAVSYILFPRHLISKLLVTSPAVRRAKASERRQEELRVLMTRGVCSDMAIVRDAVVCGDLVPPDGMDYHDVFFGLWSAQWGAMNFMSSDIPLRQLGFEDVEAAMFGSLSAMMDGFGWRPLSTEWDYNKTVRRLADEVFPPEVIEEVGGRSLDGIVLPSVSARTAELQYVLRDGPSMVEREVDDDSAEVSVRGHADSDGSMAARSYAVTYKEEEP